MSNSITHAFTPLTGGVIDDIERDDDRDGFEAEDAVRRLDSWRARRAETSAAQRRLGDYVRRLVDEGDARIAARAAAGMRGAA
ncbi:hypothetical protein [Streptomyces sp. NPDC048248]|uniref:hypothetical protein n=1 Tax=Streptomyces sp. NPDC048248 TaxID=3365523 RepID=UPI00371DA6D2